jgi:hypothetical protein
VELVHLCLIGIPGWSSTDASFAVHTEKMGHTGGILSMGQGAVYANTTRQKLVTRSSTASELVGVHDAMPDILWGFLGDTRVPVEKMPPSRKPKLYLVGEE